MENEGKLECSMQDNPQQALRYAYVAGLIDGEGSFCMCKVAGESAMAQHRINPVYNCKIRIGMTSRTAVQYVADTFPNMGSFYNEGVRKDRPDYQIMYRWEVSNRNHICNIIDLLIPYLMVKKEQATILKEFCNGWVDGRSGSGERRVMNPEELHRREDFYLRMKKLNAVGAAATTD